VACGSVVAAAFLELSWWIMIAALAVGTLIPLVYSYVIYRRIEGRT
jgi:predicted metal-binding membrane protein